MFCGIGVFSRKRAPVIHLMIIIARFSAEESQFVEMTQCVWPESFYGRRGGVAAVFLVASYNMRLILLRSLTTGNGRRYTVE